MRVPELPIAITVRREPGSLMRSLVALLLRVGLGLVFLMAGLGKFEGMRENTYPKAMIDQFEKTRLPSQSVRLFAEVLPYAEVALGGALIGGVLTPIAALLTGVLLLNLLFGLLVLGDPNKTPPMMVYLLIDAAILWLSPVTSNYLSLDGLFFGWFWSPRSEGEFRREPGAEASRAER